jgi:hypothetical protein
MADARRKIIYACENGDIPALEAIFQEFDIGSGHPAGRKQENEHNQLPHVGLMFTHACTGQQLEVLRFLCARFPNTGFGRSPIKIAIDSGNTEMLRILCKQSPVTANSDMGEEQGFMVLGYAASKGENELVKLLLKAGADPSEPPPYKLPGCWTLTAAINGNLPKSTFELFYDAGYSGRESWAARHAVTEGRPDVLEVIFRRGRHLPFAQFPSEENLIDAASEKKDPEMAALIRRLCADHSQRNKGLISKVFSKFRARR